MPRLDELLPHARSYLQGMILNKNLDGEPLQDCEQLPARWNKVTYFGTPSSSVFVHDPLVFYMVHDGYQDEEQSRAYMTERSVDPRYPFYYYEVTIESLFCNDNAR